MKFYTGIPFLVLWKMSWNLLKRINSHRIALSVAIVCLGIGAFMGLSRGFNMGFMQSQSSGAILGMVSGYTILDRLERGDTVQVELMASTLLDLSLQEFYEKGGTPKQPWFITLQYQLRGWGKMTPDTSAYASFLTQLAEYRNTHPSDYLQSHKKLYTWLESYLPTDTSSLKLNELEHEQIDTITP